MQQRITIPVTTATAGRAADPAGGDAPRRTPLLARAIGNLLGRCRPAAARSHSALALAAALSCVAAPLPAATYIVNTAGDPGPPGTISLRQAITSANAADGNFVTFDAALVGSTITLANGEIGITRPMRIIGPGSDKLTLSGNDASRIFYIGPFAGSEVYVGGLTLTHGHGDSGGAIAVDGGALTLSHSTVSNSSASVLGGAIYGSSGATLFLDTSTVSGCAAAVGGGIAVVGARAYVSRSSIRGNSASYSGGGIFQQGGTLKLEYSTISGNAIPAVQGPYANPVAGGGVYSIAGHFLSLASTVAYNYSYFGAPGVALVDDIDGSLLSSTVADNSSCCYQGGNGVVSSNFSPQIFTTIVANNFNRGGVDDLAGTFNVYYSLVRNPGNATIAHSGGSVFGLDPRLGRLANYGGPTQTMLPAADSPAVDAAPGCVAMFSDAIIDQRGLPNCVSGHSDFGAVERQNPEVVIFRNGFDPGG